MNINTKAVSHNEEGPTVATSNPESIRKVTVQSVYS